MKKLNILIFLAGVFLAGCASYGELKNTSQNAILHDVKIILDETSRSVIRGSSVKHKSFGEKVFLEVRGKLYRKEFSKYSKAIITAEFLDGKGEVISIEKTKIYFRIIGKSFRGLHESFFSLQTRDRADILKCRLSVQWVENFE